MPKLLDKPMTVVTVPLEQPTLKVYKFHGVRFDEVKKQATADCPFCGKDEGKFSVEVDTGLWKCFVCGSDGNPLTFMRLLWQRSDAATNGHGEQLATERGYLDRLTLTAWGVCRSIIDGTWLVPGYSHEGRLDQLYRRCRFMDKKKGGYVWRLLPTPGLWEDGKVHALHMPSMSFDPKKPRIDVLEGPWDGMAYWEVARQSKRSDDGLLEFTGNEAASVICDTNVIAAPGATTWRHEWTMMCKDKIVTLFYDNDHPHEHPEGSGNFTAAGRDGVKRIAGLLTGVAREVHWLQWGGGGYDSSLPTGFDVRDWLVKGVPSA